MTVLGRWWNGVWGRLARRDIWLTVSYRVTARQGDTETGKVLCWDFDSEEDARAMIERLTHSPGPGEWREMDPARAADAPRVDSEQEG
ncbi:hypothetical protein ACQP2F_00410 [Actinoplanes sp. CA-030573]|uniref:hypothetical protein n=1 Tax=Actinoplanes sp. CA-030573 TaxID=3239898 RepID=UPI003D8B99D4